MTKDQLSVEYEKRMPLYIKAKNSILQDIEMFLQENNLPYLSVSARLKDFDSFVEKVDRKSYSKPFDDNEDFCGIRIIVYYLNDIVRIEEIISREFTVVSSIDKTGQLGVQEFGYRSQHLIVKIRPEWQNAPNYRGLGDIKVEIQIRTVLMHAWAEIEHELTYKSKEEIPKQFVRQLGFLSSKLEEADEQFQKLKHDVEQYKDAIKLSVASHGSLKEERELNADSLTALLDSYLEGFPRKKSTTKSILDRLKSEGLSIKSVEKLLSAIQPYALLINTKAFPKEDLRLSQGTLLGYADDILNGFNPGIMYTDARKKIVEELKELIKKDVSN